MWAFRSRVFTWVIVTVAFPRIESCASMIDSGAPTRSPYPTTTTSAPSSSIPLRSNSSTMPYGVAGWNVGSPRSIMPTFQGCRPSTSFSGVDRALDLQLSKARRHGQLDDDAVDLRVAVEPAQGGQQLALGDVGGQVDLFAADPDVGARLVLGADVDARGLVVAHEDGGQARGHALLGERAYPLGYFRADVCGNGSAVQDPGGHEAHPTRRAALRRNSRVSVGSAGYR